MLNNTFCISAMTELPRCYKGCFKLSERFSEISKTGKFIETESRLEVTG